LSCDTGGWLVLSWLVHGSSSSCKGKAGLLHIMGSNTMIFAVLKAWLMSLADRGTYLTSNISYLAWEASTMDVHPVKIWCSLVSPSLRNLCSFVPPPKICVWKLCSLLPLPAPWHRERQQKYIRDRIIGQRCPWNNDSNTSSTLPVISTGGEKVQKGHGLSHVTYF